MPVENKDWGTDRYTPRPVEPATTAWDGTGLPPVGLECECDWRGWGQWNRAIVKFVGDLVMIVQCEGAERVIYVEDGRGAFRPLRTQAQIEREELEDLLTSAIVLNFSVKTMVSCIIERGYRLEH